MPLPPMLETSPAPRRIQFGDLERRLSGARSRIAFLEEHAAEVRAALLDRFDESGADVLSLDVFDTVLLRNDKPEALRYFEISEEASERLQALPGAPERSPEDFYVSRSLGMEVSYRARPDLDTCREGHIDEVLRSQIDQLRLPPSFMPILKQIEIDYEVRNLSPNWVLVDVCRRVKKAGGSVALLSDMYLDGGAIREIAGRVLGEIEYVDALFSSADTILSKRSGRVFALLEKAFDRPPEAFFHLGDSLESDYVQPKRAGWRAMHFPVSDMENQRRATGLARFKLERAREGLDVGKWAKV